MTEHIVGNSRAYFMDCVKGMKAYPDKAFDLAVVDIPYEIGADKPSKKPSSIKQKNGVKLGVKCANYGKKDWDKLPTQEYFNELFRVSKNQIIFGGNYVGLAGGYLIWDKLNGVTDQYGCEMAYQSFSKRTDMVYFMWSGMIQGMYCGKDVRKALVQQGDKSKNEKRIHATQKPVALYDWIFNEYAKKGDLILDTHVGSQSIRIAADRHGLDITMYETDEENFLNGCKRFDRYKSQTKINFM